jgi:DNA-directed RNA polymerase specialized sigma24 family protein
MTNDMTTTEYDEWRKKIRKMAFQIIRDYPDLELEDVMQEMWIGILMAQAKGKLLTPSERHVESTLRYIGTEYAQEQRNQHLTLSVQYAYRTRDIRKLFENFFEKQTWLDAEVPDDAKSELGPVQLELLGDLGRAYARLPLQYKQIIFRVFFLQETPENSTERVRLSHALGRCAEILNSYQPRRRHEGPGARKAISNATARRFIGE